MKLRTIALVVVAIFVLSAMAIAQTANRQAGQHRGGQAPMMGQIVKELGLSQDQAQKIQQIARTYGQDLRGISQSAGTKEEKAAKVKTLQTKAVADVIALLTADQKTKAEKMHLADLLFNPNGQQAARFLWILNQLNLTADQQAKIKPILVDFQTKSQALRNDNSIQPAERRTKMTELQKAVNDGILAVLTPEQQTKFKELNAQRPGQGFGGGRQPHNNNRNNANDRGNAGGNTNNGENN